MELAKPLAAEPTGRTSLLATLRLQRKFTIEEAAKRAAATPTSANENRVRSIAFR